MIGDLFDRLVRLKPFYLFWMSVLFSEISTVIIVAVMSIVFHGRVTGDYIVTGIVTAFLVVIMLVFGLLTLFTRIKRSWELIQNIIEVIDEGCVIIDSNFKIIIANRAYADTIKMPIENIPGRHCHDISHNLFEPCYKSGHVCPVKHVFDTGEPFAVTHTHYDKNGSPLYIDAKAYPLSKNSTGKVVTAIEILVDSTEKKNLEEQLYHSQKMESIGTFAGGIAHDFNNILTAIIGYAQITGMSMDRDDPQRLNVDQILQAAERAAHLTQSLLALSRKQRLDKKSVDLNEIVRRMERFLLRIMGEDIELKTGLNPCSSAIGKGQNRIMILADQGQIEQVLMNLATNARDCMPKGGVFTIATSETELNREFITAQGYGIPGKYGLITVTDTGTGIDDETKQRIFDPFFTTKEVGKGTGLGLSIVYGIIKQHDGYINIYSEPGAGTTFKIYLPISTNKMEEITEEKILTPEYLQKGSETILVAEDSDTVRELIKFTLGRQGYTVIEAVNGEDAVNKFIANKDNIQLLLFDIIMPKKNGQEAYDVIKELKPDVRALFISGYSYDIIREKALIGEDLPLISKPVSPVVLLQRVRDALDKTE